MYQMMRPMISFWAINIDKRYKHLSDFPTVTLQALYLSFVLPVRSGMFSFVAVIVTGQSKVRFSDSIP
jgi:hypothetical protein